jgi:hypothetical protein
MEHQERPAAQGATAGQAPPQYSSDGRWWWTGTAWVPVPPQQVRQGGTSMWTIVGALVVFAILVLIAVTVAGQMAQMQ